MSLCMLSFKWSVNFTSKDSQVFHQMVHLSAMDHLAPQLQNMALRSEFAHGIVDRVPRVPKDVETLGVGQNWAGKSSTSHFFLPEKNTYYFFIYTNLSG